MPEKGLWTRTYSTRDQVPVCPVFTRAKNQVPFWDFSKFAVTVTKVVFAVWGEKRWSHCEFVVLVVSGRSVNVFRKCCPKVRLLGVGAEFCKAVDIANFGGDVKLFLCVVYWIYLIYIQLGTLGLREIDSRGPWIRWLPSLCPCSGYWRGNSEMSALNEVVQPKRVLDGFPI